MDDLHELYVASGRCPAVNQFKVWCNGAAGHEGSHWALRQIDTEGHTHREDWPTDD